MRTSGKKRRGKEAVRREAADRVYIQRFAKAISKHYPGCPEKDADEIAQHACQKHSGRVGRSAGAKQFDASAIRLAVIAHIRHKYTRYDRLLIRYDDRVLARQEVQPKIEEILDRWENPGS